MFRFILFLVVAAALALVAVWFADNPGLVVLDWRGTRIETSVGVAVLVIAGVSLVVVLLVEIIRWLISAPGRWLRSRRRQRELQGYREFSSGMVAAAAGDTRVARLHAARAERLLPQEPAVLLLSAQTAQLEGDEDAALKVYRQMQRLPETRFVAVRGLLGQSIKLGDRDEAMELARKAYEHNPEAPWTASTYFDLLTRHEHWADALQVVTAMERAQAVDGARARRYRAALEVLVGREKLAARAPEEAELAGRQAVRQQPSFTPGAILLAVAQREAGRGQEARRTIERAWEVRPHPELAKLYAELAPEESATDRLQRFDRLRRRHPTHLETRVTMAELALAAGDAKLARSQLEEVVAKAPTARTCRLMAEIERAGGGSAEAVNDWLMRGADATPDLAWVCEETGEVYAAWQPFGGNNRFDTVSWTTPPTLSTLIAGQRPSGLTLTQSPAASGPETMAQAQAGPAGSTSVGKVIDHPTPVSAT